MAGNTVCINNVEIHLSHPDELNIDLVGFYELQKQLKACWTTLNNNDIPLVPRILGRPGVGKTTLAYSVAKQMNYEVYIYQCTMDTRPEDLIITPVLSNDPKGFWTNAIGGKNNKIKYHASALVTAMIKGGIAILDEGNRMSEKSWASLAPLFDNRRYVESITAGIKIKAHPNFRCCITMNDDSSTFEVPEYIMSRLQPQIYVDFPSRNEEKEILKINLPFAEEDLINIMSDFLANAHRFEEPFTSRDGIHIIRFTRRLMNNHSELSQENALKQSISQVLGQDAVNYLNPDYQPTFNMPYKKWDYPPEEDDLNEFI